MSKGRCILWQTKTKPRTTTLKTTIQTIVKTLLQTLQKTTTKIAQKTAQKTVTKTVQKTVASPKLKSEGLFAPLTFQSTYILCFSINITHLLDLETSF